MNPKAQTEGKDQSSSANPPVSPFQLDERLLTVDDLASYLQLSSKTVYRMLRRGQLPHYRVAGMYRFRKNDIDRWLDAQAAFDRLAAGEEA